MWMQNQLIKCLDQALSTTPAVCTGPTDIAEMALRPGWTSLLKFWFSDKDWYLSSLHDRKQSAHSCSKLQSSLMLWKVIFFFKKIIRVCKSSQLVLEKQKTKSVNLATGFSRNSTSPGSNWKGPPGSMKLAPFYFVWPLETFLINFREPCPAVNWLTLKQRSSHCLCKCSICSFSS